MKVSLFILCEIRCYIIIESLLFFILSFIKRPIA